ncbi:MAG: hypothetical protein RSD53_00915 [Algoriella sp.]
MKAFALILISSFLFSCNSNKKFESEKWIPFEEGVYGENYRYKMLDDLVNNVLKLDSNNSNGTSKNEVYKLIGKPDETLDKTDIYLIQEKIGEIDPNGEIKLYLKYSDNLTLNYWKIEETTYKE